MATDLDKIVDRVRKLLALAGGTNSEPEARTAAYNAAIMIRDHKLVVMAPAGVVERAQDDFWDQFIKQDSKQAAREKRRETPREQPKQAGGSTKSKPSIRPVQITAKFRGRCKVCEGRILAGDEIWYFTVDGESRTAHYECWQPEE